MNERIKIPLTDNGKCVAKIARERGLLPQNAHNYFKDGCSFEVFVKYKLYDYFDSTAFYMKYGDREFVGCFREMVQKIRLENDENI